MRIEWDVPIVMDDGVVLRADVFRPDDDGQHPVILSQGVYGKGLAIDRFRKQLQAFATNVRGDADGTAGADLADTEGSARDEVADDDFRVWEVADPAEWVPAGKVGLNGKSYLAMTQWLVAARRPEHLAAICVWHGESDWYRDATRHGGILYQFWERFWLPSLVLPVQHGRGPIAGVNPHSGHAIAGDVQSDAEELLRMRVDLAGDIRAHPLDDEYYRARTPRLDQIEVPVLASADWSDHDLHERGTIRGFLLAGSRDRWLEVHDGGQFDDPESVTLQRRFFDHTLKGEGDWERQPSVQLAIRRPEGPARTLFARGWPLPETEWSRLHLDPVRGALRADVPAVGSAATYASTDGHVAMVSEALSEPLTLAGPVAAALTVSGTAPDVDLFVVLEAIDGVGAVIGLRDHRGGSTPLSVGWLRVSHRELDPERSEDWAPFHTHTSEKLLDPGETVEVRVELRPTSIDLPAGSRLRLTVSGQGAAHDDPVDRPADRFDGTVTLHGGADHVAWLLLPIIPNTPSADA